MNQNLKNPMLAKTVAAYMAKVQPNMHGAVQRIVDAGHLFLYSPKTRQMVMQQMKLAGRDPEAIAGGVAKLVGILYQQSKKTAPMQALIPAGFILMCEVLQFLEDSGVLKVTSQVLAQVTQAAGPAMLQALGIQPQQIQQALAQAKAQQGGAAPAMPAAPPPRGIVAGAMGGA